MTNEKIKELAARTHTSTTGLNLRTFLDMIDADIETQHELFKDYMQNLNTKSDYSAVQDVPTHETRDLVQALAYDLSSTDPELLEQAKLRYEIMHDFFEEARKDHAGLIDRSKAKLHKAKQEYAEKLNKHYSTCEAIIQVSRELGKLSRFNPNRLGMRKCLSILQKQEYNYNAEYVKTGTASDFANQCFNITQLQHASFERHEKQV